MGIIRFFRDNFVDTLLVPLIGPTMHQPSLLLNGYGASFLLGMMSVGSRAFLSFAQQRCLKFDWFCQQCSLGASTASALKVLQHHCQLASISWYMYLAVPTNHASHYWRLLLWVPSLPLPCLWPFHWAFLLWLKSSAHSHHDCLSVFLR